MVTLKLTRSSKYFGALGSLLLMETHPYSCSALGTPDDRTWPGISELPDYKPTFPQWSPQPLASMIPRLDKDGYDVLQVRSSERCFRFPRLIAPASSNP